MKANKLNVLTQDLSKMEQLSELLYYDPTEDRFSVDELRRYRFEKVNDTLQVVRAVNAGIASALMPFRKRVEDAIREEVNGGR